MQITKTGSVRVDLLGGTIDLEPINLILPNVVTLNVATSLKAQVILKTVPSNTVKIFSQDYNKEYLFYSDDFTSEKLIQGDYFKEMSFLCQILYHFGCIKGLEVTLSSGAPAGSGLGGSSAMGITLYKALVELKGLELDILKAVNVVKGIEGRILNQGVPGYQDYFPALLGGVLALRGVPGGFDFEQLYTRELKEYLEQHLTLVYSGISRNSGINNWDVYKNFFDNKEHVRENLASIADLSSLAYHAIIEKDYARLLDLIGQEGRLREKLSTGITPSEVQAFYHELSEIGLKMCGAGGGGCFLITHSSVQKELVTQKVREHGMKILDFEVMPPEVLS